MYTLVLLKLNLWYWYRQWTWYSASHLTHGWSVEYRYQSMATATVPVTSTARPRKLAASRKSTRKAKSIQSAIVAKRISGASKAQIARDLGLAVNTVTNIVELNDVDSAIEQYRKDAIALAPLAITAVRTDLEVPGNGMLGLRVLESVGILGDNAIETQRRATNRTNGAINILVQSHDATVSVTSDVPPCTDAPTVNNDTASSQLTNGNDAATAPAPTPGKHPK